MDSDSSPSIEVAVGNCAWRAAVTNPEIICRHAAVATLRSAAEPCLGAGLADRLPGQIEVSIRLTDDAEMRGLNRTYRGQDKPTNVLSFEGDDMASAGGPGEPWLLGDVVLAFETVAGEASMEGRPLEAHLAHLVVHGVLHLLGHDHEDEAEASTMEALESRIVLGLGFADPHGADPHGELGSAAVLAAEAVR